MRKPRYGALLHPVLSSWCLGSPMALPFSGFAWWFAGAGGGRECQSHPTEHGADEIPRDCLRRVAGLLRRRDLSPECQVRVPQDLWEGVEHPPAYIKSTSRRV